MARPFEELWIDYLEGDLDEVGIVELNDLLMADENLLQQAADLYEEHRLLGFALQPFDSDSFVETVRSAATSDRDAFVGDVLKGVGIGSSVRSTSDGSVAPVTRRWTRSIHALASVAKRNNSLSPLLVVAVLTVGLLVAAFIWRKPSEPEGRVDAPTIAESDISNKSSVRPIATLLLADDCFWAESGTPQEGQRLGRQLLELKSGLAVVRFDGGAELVMSGETSVELLSSGRAELQFGEVVVRAEDGADGFELRTPASPLVDLGTEFAARVDRGGTTEVHVIDGEVEYVHGNATEVLTAGKAILLAGADAAAKDASWKSRSFDEILRDAAPKSQPHRMTAYEGFYYEPGFMPLEETTKGKGWAGPWRRRLLKERRSPDIDVSPDRLEIVHGQLNVTWPVPGGRKGMLKLQPGAAYYVRPLQQPIHLDREGVTYFSLMVKESERPKDSKPRERLRLTFRSSEDYYEEWVSFGHGPGYRPHVQSGPGVSHTSAMVLPPEQTTLWVGKIVRRQHGEDEIYFRVYGEEDVLGYAEPATWHVVTRGVDHDAHLDRVLLSSNGVTARIVDELRIGPTWRSVAPMLEE